MRLFEWFRKSINRAKNINKLSFDEVKSFVEWKNSKTEYRIVNTPCFDECGCKYHNCTLQFMDFRDKWQDVPDESIYAIQDFIYGLKRRDRANRSHTTLNFLRCNLIDFSIRWTNINDFFNHVRVKRSEHIATVNKLLTYHNKKPNIKIPKTDYLN